MILNESQMVLSNGIERLIKKRKNNTSVKNSKTIQCDVSGNDKIMEIK